MPKRKHSEFVEDSKTADRVLKATKKACGQRLEKGKKELEQALKLAAGFERQKQGRRKKSANGDEEVVGRLEREYAVLKALDAPKLAEDHIRKTIARVKSVSAHVEALPKWAKQGDKEVHSKETLDVLARLYKSQAVKNTLDHLIDDLKTIFGIAVSAPTAAKTDAPEKKVEKMALGGVGARAGLDKKTKAEKPKVEKVKMDKAKVEVEDPKEENGYSESEEEFNGFESDALESDDFAEFDVRIAGPSSDEDSDAEDSVAERARIYPPSVESSNSDSDSDSDVPSDHRSGEYSGEESDSSAGIPTSKRKLEAAPLAAKPAKSTFLPSLTMGGYMSGSDSSASDLDEDLVAPRKNRRGQRARQQIWEKKFGESAKHLAKKKNDRNAGWDPKKGAQLDDGGRGKKGRRDTRDSRGGGRGPKESGANAEPVAKKKTKRDDVGALHPSWAAAKAAKEKKLSAVPMGKKVVFD